MPKQNRLQTVLIVDDTPENLDLLKAILAGDYQVQAAINGQLALKIAEAQQPDLVLLDIMMPGMDGYEVCRKLKANPLTAKIPVIFVTAMSDLKDEMRGFEVGAIDFIMKPVQPGIVRARVATHIALANQRRACELEVRRRTHAQEESQRAAVFMLGEAGHYNDTDTGVHIWRMAAYAAALARAAGWPVEQAGILELAAPMHDTGKIGIPDEILKAPRKLTAEEWEVMMTHTTIGYEILSKSDTELFDLAAEVALSHHEKWDGSGYPRRLAGDNIPECARIVAIADVFDALTMRRPYKEPWPVEKAMALIRDEAGKHFDPQLVERFIAIEAEVLAIMAAWSEREQDERAA
jgi:putative two-component system response regulator